MSWLTPTLQQCIDRIPKEWPALSTAAKTDGQDADTLAEEVITDQVNRIRGRVPSGVILGAAGTIPDELKSAFFALWVYEFLIKLPKMKQFLDDLRVKAYENAIDELKQLSMNRITLVPPTDAAPAEQQAGGSGVTVVSKTDRRATRAKLNGLF